MSDELSERLAGLSPQEQRALLVKLLQRRQHAPQRAPLSFAQERLWILHQLEPNSSAYNIPLALRLSGALDLNALRQSLNAVVQRHAVLRTTFALEAGQVLQVIAPQLTLAVPLVELADRSPAEREAQLQQALQEEARQPFDLSRGPLLRARVWRLGPAEHVLLVTLHHSVSDAWSVAIFTREMVALYQAALTGQAARLPDLPLQYADYAVWQRAWLSGALEASQLAYWTRQLAGAPELLALPTDHPRPAVQTQRGATHFFWLSPDVSAALHTFSRQEGVTLYMTLLAAFNLLLHRYTGQTDIVVGTPIAHRNRSELEALIGFFVNTLALRTRFSAGETVRELVRQVRESVLAAYAHQDVPFERVVEHLQPARHLDRSPVFQVLFALQNVPQAPLHLPGVRVEALVVETGAAPFDVTVLLEESAGELRGAVEYNTDLFEAGAIARLVSHFQTLLAAFPVNAERRLAEAPLLSEPERQQVVVDWNATHTPFPQNQCIHELFEAQAESRPAALAARFEQEALTYGELNARANQLAWYLQGLGVGPETLVGLCVERSLDLVVAVLGILKAGGAYVPLDPVYPGERLRFMLADSGVGVVLTQTHLRDRLPEHNARVVCLDADWPAIAQSPITNPQSPVISNNLAYVIYTSGSTGRPKGVLVTHRGIANLAEAQGQAFGIQPDSRVLQFASFSFDASVSEIFTTWLRGATLYLARPDSLLPGAPLAQLLRDSNITVVTLPPSALAVLPPDELPALRTIVSAGEACSADLVKRWGKGRRFLNGYGPTEATVCATMAVLDGQEARTPSMGRPIANTQVYILDAQLQPVPIGVPGELYIAGVGLARGYLNRPDLTAEKFIPNLFIKDEGGKRKDDDGGWKALRVAEGSSSSLAPEAHPLPAAGAGRRGLIPHHLPPKRTPCLRRGQVGEGSSLLYKTGDLARWRPDGNLEFLGRIDHQVKVRGFRIELGEIEAALSQHPAVRECVVVAQAWGATDDNRLVAYLAPKSDRFSSLVSELRAFLRAKLPEYMLPSAFVFLDAFPLTPNGKVDRKALPAPDGARPELADAYVAPRTRVETTLADIWAQVLRVERVGVHDNFFEIGGDSILSIQAMARANQAGLPLSPKHIFQHQTIAELAAVASADPESQAIPGPASGSIPVVQFDRPEGDELFKVSGQENVEDAYPLTPMQAGMLFHTLYAPESGVYFEQLTCTLSGELNTAAFEQAWQQVVERHTSLRTAFRWEGQAEPFQIVYRRVRLPVEQHDWRELPADEQARRLASYLEADRTQGFDLSRPPLIRLALIHLNEDAYQFVWSHHHLLLDGWSLFLLLKEVFACYDAFSHGRGVQLETPRPYRDYIAWLQQRNLSDAEVFWRHALQGFHAPAPLTVDRALADEAERPAGIAGYAEQSIRLSSERTAALQQFSRQQRVTLNTLVQGAWALLLSRYSGQDDIVFGMTVSGRPAELRGVEEILGLFINTLPVRVRAPATGKLLPWLKELQAQQVELQQYEHSPLVQVQGWSEAPRGQPLFESLVVFENYPVDPALREAGKSLKVDHVRVMEKTNYPITLIATPGAELSIQIDYQCRRFDAATIARMLGHLQTLLEGMPTHPDQALAQLPLLTSPERQQLLVEWNATQAEYPKDQCLPELFEAQVERTPNAVALVYGDQLLTYRELNQRANQLAHHLQKLGVGPEVRVGICVERSLEMVVGLLGILKAGGAYVPLDPTYPPERLQFMLTDSQVAVLLTQARLLPVLPAHGAQVVCLDRAVAAISRESAQHPCATIDPDNLAYIIYTSGSTGRPKGAMIHQRGLTNYLTWCRQAYPLSEGQGAPVHSSIAFDLTVTSLWAPLVTGRRVLLLPETSGIDALSELLRDPTRFSLVKITPAHLQLLGEQLSPQDAAARTQAFVIGGENLLADHVAFWQTHAADTLLINEYGPTETVVGCCVYTLPQDRRASGVMPIGRPIINTRLYVLDAALQPAPIGVVGELYVGGAGVARGYWQRPDLTAEKFIPDPFGAEPGARLYRTGDLARYLPDGNLECLGRVDHQVKIRGYRIEPGEIEAVLVQHPQVQEAVVISREDAPGVKRLVAYFVLKPDPSSSLSLPPSAFVSDLRAFLRAKLPEYMLPSAFVVLEQLPLTPNGKVDRQALPVVDGARPELAAAYVAPRTPVETILVDIWAQVLRVERVGVHDNFFEIGGDSIRSIQVIARANQAGLHLSPKHLFQYQTIAELAVVAGLTPRIQAEQGLVTGLAPLTPIQHWFFEQQLPNPGHFNQALLFTSRPGLNPVLLQQAVQHLLAHHDALRLRFERAGQDWQQVNAGVDGDVPFDWIDLGGMPETDQSTAIENTAARLQASLDLTAGPLLRAAFFDRGESQPGRLLVIVHHLAIDGVSWRILLEDLEALYRQLSRGETLRLPPKTTAFTHWAERLAAYARSASAAQALGAWLNRPWDRVSPLPVDYRIGANSVASVQTVSVSLSVEETESLLREAPQAYHTQINDMLLTALARTCARWSGRDVLLIDLEGHGREAIVEDVDLSRTVGWFTSIFPVLLQMPAAQSLGDALKSIKEQLRQIPDKGITYGVLRYLGGETNAGKLRELPQAEISFNYLGQLDPLFASELVSGLAPEVCGPYQDPAGVRRYLLSIDGGVTGGRLQLTWAYSRNLHRRSTIEQLARGFVEDLRAIIAHCRSPEAGGYTPSDFAAAEHLAQAELDDLLAEFGEVPGEHDEQP